MDRSRLVRLQADRDLHAVLPVSLFLVGAAAAAVPIVLHLLKREPEPRVKFAAVRLLKQAPVEYTDRRRLRELLLLALRVAALVLLALAFARPFLASGAAVGSAGVTVVALDTSYSLSAPGAFERARQLAKDGDQPGAGRRSGRRRHVCRRCRDRRQAGGRSRAGAVGDRRRRRPGFGATRYRAALSAAVAGARRPPRHHRRRHRPAGERLGRRRSRVGARAARRSRSPTSARMPPNLAVTGRSRRWPTAIVATVQQQRRRGARRRARS